MHLGDVFGAGRAFLLHVLDLGRVFQQGRDLFAVKGCVHARVLQDDGPVVDVRQAPEHVHGHRLIRAGRGHGDDGVRAGPLRSPGKEQHLGHGDAGATEDHRQPSVHLLQHRVQVTDAFLFAQEIEFAHHHRPDDAVLPATAAEVRRGPQIRRVDLVVLPVRCGQQPEDALQMIETRHGNVSLHRGAFRIG